MTTYRAVVKYPLDATPTKKRRELVEGLEMIAAELVDEHGFDESDLERALEDAQSFGEAELQQKRLRETDD